MALEVRQFQIAVPAGTLQNAPLVSPMTMPPRIVRRIEVRIPPGPAGLMGFQVAAAGVQIIPVNRGAFVVTDNEVIGWDLHGMITSGAFQLIAYNLGVFAHTVFLRFLVDLPDDQTTTQVPAPLSLASLSPLPDAATITAAGPVTA